MKNSVNKVNSGDHFITEQDYADNEIIRRKETKKSGWNCEYDNSHPNGCRCVPNLIGTPQYPSEQACIDTPNCCKKWDCQNTFCNDYDDFNAPFDTQQDCLNIHPNGCGDDYDCTSATGNVCGPVNYQSSYQTLTSCQTAFPNGCQVQQNCCDVWVCVDKCCKSLQLCKPVGGDWGDNYPGGFPWNLTESSSVPPREFNRILKKNLLLEWMCNMDWVVHFGIWLSSTKLECQEGAPWISFQSTQGGTGCGPCDIQDDGEIEMEKMDINTATDIINKWKEEGRVEKLSEDFYKNIVTLVEEIYRTQKLLKG